MWPKLWLGIRDKSTSISTIICGCFAFLGNFFRWSTCALRDKGPVTPIVRSFTLTLVLCVGGDRKKITLISRSTYVLNAFAGRELQASIWDNRQSWKGNYMASDDSIVVLQFSCNLIGLYTKRFCSRSSTSLESLKCHHKFRACAHIGMPIFGISPLSLDLSQRCGSLLLPHLHPTSGDLLLPLYHCTMWPGWLSRWLALTRCLFWEWRHFMRTTSTGGSHLRRPKMWASVNIQLAGFCHKWSADSQVGGSQAADCRKRSPVEKAKFTSAFFYYEYFKGITYLKWK